MSFIKVRSLQSKILILFIFLLFVVQSVSFFTTFRASQKLESTQLSNRITNANDVFQTQLNNRRYYLSAFSETAAKDYGLKSVLQEDQKSILVALNNHRKRIDSDLAMAIDNDDNIFAQLVTYKTDKGQNRVRVGEGQGSKYVTQPHQFEDNNAQLTIVGDRLFQLSLSPIKSGARTVGWLSFGYLIDQALAQELAMLTDVNVAFVLQQGDYFDLVASSTDDYVSRQFFQDILNENETNYIYESSIIGEVGDKQLVALLFKSKADVLAAVGVQWPRLVVLIILTLLLSIMGALAIAKGITTPIKQLINQVKAITAGNYDGHVTVDESVELKQLSDEFNNMTKAIVSREETISFQAFHEQLTHLPNRNALINALIKREAEHQDYIVIQLSYLDAQQITDTLGYKIGDEVVMHVAKRLVKLPLSTSCFHLGNENFVLLAPDQPVEPLIEQVLAQLNVQCEFENVALHLQFVLGVAVAKLHRSSKPAEVLQKSNVALQHAKSQKSVYQIYQPEFDTNAMERLFLTNSLKKAIEQDELVLFYQPKLDLSTMTISHVEALVRWQHPEKGLIPPDAFISIAEKTGQMPALTKWVTKTAVAQYMAWQKQGIDINIAINISAVNLLDQSYPDFVIEQKQQFNLPDQALILEVTEDAVVEEPETATRVLNYLREHGFKLSIDDYGTGYSSLGQLKQLPVQELKIDRSFVQYLACDESDQIIVRSTLELAHNLGLSVVAEGIEDETALLWLKQHGCQFAQGFYISKPLPADVLNKWMENTPYQIRKTEG